MKITIVGAGYVGLVTGACLADTGNEVWCVDKNESKISKLEKGIIPIYEPGLESIVVRGVKEKRLFFTNNLQQALDGSEICFLTVDTPSDANGAADLTNVMQVADTLGNILKNPLQLITKSTVPVGTTIKIRQIIQAKLKERKLDPSFVTVASNPEFLKEGTAVQDFRYPDRIVVGVESPEHSNRLKELYEPFMRKQDCFLVMDIASAELAKYAANAMLATRISFMNEMANLCEKIGANVSHIRQAIGWDPRIGPHFLYPGLGYGGSCFPKDVLALIELGKKKKSPLHIIQATYHTNQNQKNHFLKKMADHFGGPEHLKNKTVALWGIAFKPETDDIRYAPAIFLATQLLEMNATIRAFDPVAMENARNLFGNKITFCLSNYECLENADCLIIATEWSEFRSPDFSKMKKLMKNPLVFDGRNLYPPEKMKELGFDYCSIGR